MQDAKDAVTNIRYLKGSTDTAAALRLTANTMFNTFRGARGDNSGVSKIGKSNGRQVIPSGKSIILTDGQSNSPGDTSHAAQQLRDAGVSLFAVGIGKDVDVSELNTIASDPDCSHVFELAGFDEVIDFVEQIRRLACKEPAQLKLGSDIIRTLQAGQNMFLTFVADVNKGIKIDIATHMGEVELYLSAKTKNPNSASHQWKCRGNMHERGRCFIPPGQLKKLVRDGRTRISVYAGYVADEAELARFYTIITADGNKDVYSVVLTVALICVKFLLS
ncbi:collagen alpha-1(XIV) chain-like [Liolophura sinensis]|uniref:collagen alpha-1(XIV) chain-like n=1 Tax=Liolophura sinensis TaxID=3198878 RepID=UPI0031597420